MRKSVVVGVAMAIGLTAALLPGAASATEGGTQTLADVLLSDSVKDDPDGFDRRGWDYDIVTQAVLLFPDLVAAADDPNAQLTVLLPTDEAFRVLVKEITGERVRSEADEQGYINSINYRYANVDIAAANDKRRRVLLSKTIQIRNAQS